ncbi:helix-turn-helix domain-containing protein [Fundicoccus sp. Sow4_H7]|uniref:helix-turn-helix domain-containing protein n=1 Tax=Fundicoccus sp. Sow4_H7 TaxID=3438784 RepID=UPI003F935DC8
MRYQTLFQKIIFLLCLNSIVVIVFLLKFNYHHPVIKSYSLLPSQQIMTPLSIESNNVSYQAVIKAKEDPDPFFYSIHPRKVKKLIHNYLAAVSKPDSVVPFQRFFSRLKLPTKPIIHILISFVSCILLLIFYYKFFLSKQIEALSLVVDNGYYSSDMVLLFSHPQSEPLQDETISYQRFILSLIEGNIIYSELPSYIKQLQLNDSFNDQSRYIILLSQIQPTLIDSQVSEAHQLISNMIETSFNLKPITVNHNQQLVILPFKDSHSNIEIEQTVIEIAKSIQKHFISHFNQDIYFGLSHVFQELTNSHLAFEEAQIALQKLEDSNKATILTYNNVSPSDSLSLSVAYPKPIEYQLIQALHFDTLETATHHLDAFFEHFHSDPSLIGMLEVSVVQLVNTLLILTYEQNDDTEFEFIFKNRENILKNLIRFPKYFYIKTFLVQHFLLPIYEGNQNTTKKESKQISKAMIELIQNHYNLDITLEWVAQKLNYSPNYLSNVFSSEMGIPFTEYLNKVRIDKCLYLLEHTNLKIFEISNEIGYTQPQNFNRFFKGIVGISPGIYRDYNKNKLIDSTDSNQ